MLARLFIAAHLAELGVTGTHIQSGLILNEEFNSELTWKEGLRTWDTMRRVEPQISSTLRMIELPILSAEDLAIFKVLFDRPKDWVDVAEMLFAQGPAFDGAYATSWLRRILPRDDARLARFAALLRDPAQDVR